MTPVEAPQDNGGGDAHDEAGEGERLPHLDDHGTQGRLNDDGFAATDLIRHVHAVHITVAVEGLGDALSARLAAELFAVTS